MCLTSSSAPTSCFPEGILQHPISRPIAQAYKQFPANYQLNILEVVIDGLLGESQEGKVKEKKVKRERGWGEREKARLERKIREREKNKKKEKSFIAGLETRSLHPIIWINIIYICFFEANLLKPQQLLIQTTPKSKETWSQDSWGWKGA